MPLRKIRDSKPICISPEHNPPTHMYLEAGTYEYTCPMCGEKQVFTVMGITCSTGNTSAQFSKSI